MIIRKKKFFNCESPSVLLINSSLILKTSQKGSSDNTSSLTGLSWAEEAPIPSPEPPTGSITSRCNRRQAAARAEREPT